MYQEHPQKFVSGGGDNIFAPSLPEFTSDYHLKNLRYSNAAHMDWKIEYKSIKFNTQVYLFIHFVWFCAQVVQLLEIFNTLQR